ncbi:spore germination protein [Metabacillus sp. FJAT-52054]|uniref:Spore germination protein n=1 Tax=Metabacillus sediminis TaxID=3117746 RepID=A0ABZ2NN97_9BACI
MKNMDGSPKTSMPELMAVLRSSSDFIQFGSKGVSTKYWISYFRTLVDTKMLHESVLAVLSKVNWTSLEELKNAVPVENIILTSDTDVVKEKLLQGFIMISLSEYGQSALLIRVFMEKARQVSLPEVEFSVVGPKEAFVESLESNIHLIRKRMPSDQLRIREINIGKLTHTKVAVIYMESIANDENVRTVWQRLNGIEIDHISDSSVLTEIMSDNQNSPFPQLLDSERPDRVVSILSEGKIVIVVDGSPQVLIGPSTLIEFFTAFDDYFFNYIVASFFRIVRLASVAFSILVTPVYVATLNFHYELIPRDLLNTLVSSREEIPLPPILEAIFLELTIELLREAGARLPTKVGQTIGIVGGIVIGTASVEAGLTSNVLLIIVALAALASFTTPVYKMSNTIRLIRFPFLLFAEFYGLLGIVFCFCVLATHLLKLSSLGRPFLEPIYPPRTADMKDALIRLPFSMMSKRPIQLRTKQPIRFDKKRASQKKDIDE